MFSRRRGRGRGRRRGRRRRRQPQPQPRRRPLSRPCLKGPTGGGRRRAERGQVWPPPSPSLSGTSPPRGYQPVNRHTRGLGDVYRIFKHVWHSVNSVWHSSPVAVLVFLGLHASWIFGLPVLRSLVSEVLFTLCGVSAISYSACAVVEPLAPQMRLVLSFFLVSVSAGFLFISMSSSLSAPKSMALLCGVFCLFSSFSSSSNRIASFPSSFSFLFWSFRCAFLTVAAIALSAHGEHTTSLARSSSPYPYNVWNHQPVTILAFKTVTKWDLCSIHWCKLGCYTISISSIFSSGVLEKYGIKSSIFYVDKKHDYVDLNIYVGYNIHIYIYIILTYYIYITYTVKKNSIFGYVWRWGMGARNILK